VNAATRPRQTPRPQHLDIAPLSRAGQLLGIEVLDHIIVADASYCSFKERGIL
jgi:DNA repair protein RadC